jgi:hypothetical protein
VQIDLPSPVDEVTRARELAERIRTERNEDDARRLAHELGWLSGDVAADLQLDLLLNRDGANPLRVNVEEGLWRARDRRRVVQRLERAIADPAQLLNARGDVLWHLTTLRFSLDGTAPLYLERVAAESLRFGYVQRVAQSLPQRSGESLIDAVAVVLDVAEPDSAEAAAAVGALQAHFDDIDPYLIEWLLSGHLAQFTGPQLRAGLHSALDRRRDVPLDAALSALGRRWPEDLAPYALAEACAERPALLRSLAGLRPGPLPEADACLRRRLLAEAAQPKRDLYWLAVTLEYVARLASPALVPDVEALLPALEARSQKAELNNARDYLARSAPAARR